MHSDLTNHEIVVIAAFLEGAAREPADTEDIAIKANLIAPGRFTWRKYRNQINIETVRKRLWDARKKENGGYLVGSEREGWLLTAAGLAFAKRRKRFVQSETKERLSLNERRWLRTERKRLSSTTAYAKFKSGRASTISVREAEGFFRIDSYIWNQIRENKILRLSNAFGRDRDLGAVVRFVADMVRGGVPNGNKNNLCKESRQSRSAAKCSSVQD